MTREKQSKKNEKQSVSVVGTFAATVKRADGSIVTQKTTNLITSWGLGQMAQVLSGVAISPAINQLALGGGNNPPTESDTSLQTEITRTVATVTQLSGADNNKVEFTKSWTQGEITGTFREAGLFNSASAGDMFNRLTYSDITVTATDTFEVVWTVEFRNT